MATPAAQRINHLRKITMKKIYTKLYLLELTKDQKEMIEGTLHQSIDFTKDAINENEFEGDKESVKELKQEMKLMRESLRAVRAAKATN